MTLPPVQQIRDRRNPLQTDLLCSKIGAELQHDRHIGLFTKTYNTTVNQVRYTIDRIIFTYSPRISLMAYPTKDKTINDSASWIEMRYNHVRLHSALQYRAPNKVERELLDLTKTA